MLASVFLALALFSTAYSAPQVVVQTSPHYIVPLLSKTEVRDDHNQYSLAYQTGDGQAISSHGALKVLSNGDQVLVQQGTVAYTAPDGTPVSLAYIADEQGYRAEGTHIPKTPEPAL